ncbi:MAG: O-methyltransferase [Armatimonadetes bacterium]|nr:O-methyltransferase [Armatimonadota bacterium]
MNTPIQLYLKDLERSRGDLLAEMEQEAREKEFPIIGAQCGRRLMIFAMMIGASKVFEMGSGFGYSTLWFGHAVGPLGQVTHTDGDPANTEQARKYIGRAGMSDRVRFLTGDAVALLTEDDGLYDVILIDIDKQDYPKALTAAIPKLRIGGLVLTHNATWGNRVADPNETEETTEGIREYNRGAFEHPELATFLDPVDDGLAISLKLDASVRAGLPL